MNTINKTNSAACACAEKADAHMVDTYAASVWESIINQEVLDALLKWHLEALHDTK